MIRRFPLGLAAGLALVAGLASCQETEEDTSQLGTGSPASASAAPVSSAPVARTPGSGETLYRWVNLTVLIPDDPSIRAGPNFAGATLERQRAFSIIKVDPEDSRIVSEVLVNAEDGAMLEENILEQHRTDLDLILATVNLTPFDTALAPWPYSGEPTPDLKREKQGGISWIEPPPSTGLYVGGGLSDPGGVFISIRNERSIAFVGPDPVTGVFSKDTSSVVAEDLAVFNRWLDTVKQCGTEIEC